MMPTGPLITGAEGGVVSGTVVVSPVLVVVIELDAEADVSSTVVVASVVVASVVAVVPPYQGGTVIVDRRVDGT